MTPIRVVCGVTWQGGRILLTQRPPGGERGLQWEFPGGKIEAGETPEQAVVREIREELGVEATPLRVLAEQRHAYADGLAVELTFIEVALASRVFTPNAAVHASRWEDPAGVDAADVLEGDRPFLAELAAGRYRPLQNPV